MEFFNIEMPQELFARETAADLWKAYDEAVAKGKRGKARRLQRKAQTMQAIETLMEIRGY